MKRERSSMNSVRQRSTVKPLSVIHRSGVPPLISAFLRVARRARRLFVPAVVAPPVHRHAFAEGEVCRAGQATHDFMLLRAQLVPLTQLSLAAARALVFFLSHDSLFLARSGEGQAEHRDL